MSYSVLARKWRPNTFTEVVGQDLAVKTLTNSLDNQRLHHAYLFSGTRGTGKTTLARIFAKSLNCEEGISSKPCLKCSICESVNQGNFIDLTEIDAASRTKVEDTREILENVRYQPTAGKFKVYIIDEVHMLSNSSFNALLKTLEEPPEFVKFILATTDPKKLPITVLSRCIQLHLSNIQPNIIAKQLQEILESEKVKFEVTATESIAKSASGSMRDALSLTDQLIAQTNANINNQAVLEMLGTYDIDKIEQLVASLLCKDIDQCFATINQLDDFAPDYSSILTEICTIVHNLAICQQFGELKTKFNTKLLADSKLNAEDIQVVFQMSTIAGKQLPLAPNLREGFNMFILRVYNYLTLGDDTKKKP